MSEEFHIKDSGQRVAFNSGMVRDVEDDKADYTLIRTGPMLTRWAEHLTKGAHKYGRNNWTLANSDEEYERFRRSAARHFEQWITGERDEDHAAAVFFNINAAEHVKADGERGSSMGVGEAYTPMSGWIETYTGLHIEPLRPDPDLISIEDIAHALSNNCRFTGHVREFYSVAQHSVLASYIVPDRDSLEALLHDASEAYLSDIARPVKHQPEFGAVYKKAEDRLMTAIALRFGISWPMSETVRWADEILLRTEQRDLMPDPRPEGEEHLEYKIVGWAPAYAEERFLDRYNDLTSLGG